MKFNILYLFIGLTIFNSCSNNFTLKNSLDNCKFCSNRNDCITLVNCGQTFFNGQYKNRINDSLNLDKILECTIEQAKIGNKKAQDLLIEYFHKRYNYYKEAEYPAAAIADYYYFYEVKVFSNLRGKKAFDLALLFAKETKCVDHGDVFGGGNLGLNVIEYIINPMIKSVGGDPDLSGYLSVDNYKNRTIKSKSNDPCIASHEEYYGELIKAYKEGKIVLKKYGEE